MYSQSDALILLERYDPIDENELIAKRFIYDFVRQNVNYWSRSTLNGHLTASAWITNQQQNQAVLLHHKKLDIWVQPGGHIDSSDESLQAASLREAQEETGLKQLKITSTDIFDLDIHLIPARKLEPEHWHLDVRFLFVAEQPHLEVSQESNAVVWFGRSEIEKLTEEESVLRMVRKTL